MSDSESDKPESIDNIVSLEPRLKKGATSLLLLKREIQGCHPHSFFIDLKKRTVSCARCERVFDAFEAVKYLAEHWPDYHGNREAIAKEIASLSAEKERLTKEIKNLRATVRRAGGDPSDPNDPLSSLRRSK